MGTTSTSLPYQAVETLLSRDGREKRKKKNSGFYSKLKDKLRTLELEFETLGFCINFHFLAIRAIEEAAGASLSRLWTGSSLPFVISFYIWL